MEEMSVDFEKIRCETLAREATSRYVGVSLAPSSMILDDESQQPDI